MGLLFEHDGCQLELFSGGTEGVFYANLTTGKRHHIASKDDVPLDWPQNAKDALDRAQFVVHDVCSICLQPQTPLCRCVVSPDDPCVPNVLARIDPPRAIDPLEHLMCQARKTIEIACSAARAPDRSRRSRWSSWPGT